MIDYKELILREIRDCNGYLTYLRQEKERIDLAIRLKERRLKKLQDLVNEMNEGGIE